MYLRFVHIFFSRDSLDDRGLTLSFLYQKYSISVCPKYDIQKMIIFMYSPFLPTRFSIRLSLSVFSCFCQRHLTNLRHVLNVHACLVIVIVKQTRISSSTLITLQTMEEFGSQIVLYTVLLWLNFDV